MGRIRRRAAVRCQLWRPSRQWPAGACRQRLAAVKPHPLTYHNLHRRPTRCAGLCWLAGAAAVKDAMDYFRAVFQSHETSERAFHLTSKGIDNKPANYTVWYATNVATLVVQTRATSPVGGRRVGVAFFVCRSAKRCARRPLWSFGLASSSSSLGLAVLWRPAGQCAARLCKGWWCVLLSGHPACVNAAALAAGTVGGRWSKLSASTSSRSSAESSETCKENPKNYRVWQVPGVHWQACR